eukprot:1650231-Pyramimonas_sp.AAC.1
MPACLQNMYDTAPRSRTRAQTFRWDVSKTTKTTAARMSHVAAYEIHKGLLAFVDSCRTVVRRLHAFQHSQYCRARTDGAHWFF